MKKLWKSDAIRNILLSLLIFAAAILLCYGLSLLHDDNNAFTAPVFILAVALIARVTSRYLYGVTASVLAVLCVNYFFTYPFWELNLSLAGYPLTFAAMLVVSLLISALTTQLKRTEQLRFDAEKEKMRANLLRAVSHDIRTPLTSIMGASSTLLESGSLGPEQADLVQEIGKDARWLIRMTENILSVTRFAGESVMLKKSEEVVEEIVGSAIVKFRKNHPGMPVRVTKPAKILLVPMDATLIEQVLINLFENVSAHAETATQIWLTVAEEHNSVAFTVEDDGTGFPQSLLPHIWSGYAAMAARRRSDDRRNMGIGLSVCHSIIRAHGGGMNAYNSPRGGAAVRFWLPIEEDEHVDRP